MAAHRGLQCSKFERRRETLLVKGECVVAMGYEIVAPKGDVPNSGKTVKRRYTNYEEPLRRETKIDGAKNWSASGDLTAGEPPLAGQPLAEKPGLDNRHLINTERYNPETLTTEKDITDRKANGAFSSLKESENQENSQRKFYSPSQTSDSKSIHSAHRPRAGLTVRERRFYEREERRAADLSVAPIRIRDNHQRPQSAMAGKKMTLADSTAAFVPLWTMS